MMIRAKPQMIGPWAALGRSMSPQASSTSRGQSAWTLVEQGGALRAFLIWELLVIIACLIVGTLSVAVYEGAQLQSSLYP